MTDTVRCPACRGAKKVPKLGGVVGECNGCKGKGTILEKDKPVPVVVEVVTPVADIVSAVSEAVPASTLELKESQSEMRTLELAKPPAQVSEKKNIYKRKKA